MARNSDNSHINERRLRPIYDCLDNGNNKKALQEAEKVLKKQKDLLCAKVLKGLALLRMGRHEESLNTLKEVHDIGPTDDSTLQAMTICYRELHKVELIANAYEIAIKKDPSNEELHSHLFMAYVRMSDYQKQKLTAMSLYKLKPKNPYYFWAVMSILMQAISSNDRNIAQKITLPLAEKMCEKFLDEGKIEAEAEVELYLMILEKQSKHRRMLEVIDSPIGAKLGDYLDFLSKRKANLLKLEGRYIEAFNAYKSLIENNIDQIEYYLEIFEISDILDENESNDGIEKSFHYNCSVLSLIEKCIDKGNTNSNKCQTFQSQRGPYLAKMVLLENINKRQQTHGDVQHLLKRFSNSMTDLLFDYFVEFGSKNACIYDMYYILDKTNLNRDDVRSMTLQMKKHASSLSEPNNDIKVMQKIMCCLFISHYTGQHDNMDDENLIKLVKDLLEKYNSYYHNIVVKSELTITEPQPTDPFIILISNILLINMKSLEDRLVIQLIVILEWALIKSPANFYFKLILIKLYNSLGAVSPSHSLLESLDIKHIQNDSLGYIFLTPFTVCGHFSTSSLLLGNALKFYSSNVKDTLDYLISCYKYGSFTKVEEIIRLRDRLNNSLQYCSASIDRMILDLILETKNHSATENIINYMEIDPEKDKFVWEDISDNRDFSVFSSNHQKTEEILKEKQMHSLTDELLWLKIRNLLIRSIAASHYSLVNHSIKKDVNEYKNSDNKSETNGTEKRTNVDVLIDIISKLSHYTDSVKRTTFTQSLLPIESPNLSRIGSFSRRNYMEVLLSLLNSIVDLHNDPKQLSLLNSAQIFASIINDLELIITSDKSLVSLRTTLEELTNCIETFSIALILIGISRSIMKNKMNILNKKNRKKKDISKCDDIDSDSLVSIYTTALNRFEESANRVEQMLRSIDFSSSLTWSSFDLIDFPEIDSVSIFSATKVKVEESYKKSIKEMTELLQNKIIYLQTLKF